jgi:superfamily II DNA helicase RecQ
MRERRCRYCQKSFQVSKFRPLQTVCSEAACQRQRRTDYHRDRITADPEYRDVCRDSPRKWRARNPGYWSRYRAEHPDTVARNREQQKLRDSKQRLLSLANNTLARDLKHSAAEIWLVGAGAERLANNNVAPGQVWVIEAFAPFRSPLPAPCKQHPSGSEGVSAG